MSNMQASKGFGTRNPKFTNDSFKTLTPYKRHYVNGPSAENTLNKDLKGHNDSVNI